jgi:L-lactate utilization protein LutC
MERAAFLDRLRTRLAGDAAENVAHPLVRIDAVPPVRYDQDLDDPVAAFTRNAGVQGASVEVVDDASAFVARVIDATGARRVVVSRDPETEGISVPNARTFDGSDPEADLGVVGAAFGIAATGTVVFDAGRAGGRSASLLPPAICVLVRADAILREAGDVFRRMPERFPEGLPSQLVLCTGPSKSGDIELVLTTGVHGPGRVWIGVLQT